MNIRDIHREGNKYKGSGTYGETLTMYYGMLSYAIMMLISINDCMYAKQQQVHGIYINEYISIKRRFLNEIYAILQTIWNRTNTDSITNEPPGNMRNSHHHALSR